MRITIQPERHDEHFHLRHQGLWFILLLIVMLLLLSKNVATTWTIDDGRWTMDDGRRQCVIAYSSTLIPIA